MNVHNEIVRLRDAWPAEFADGARYGLLGKADGPRERGGYPFGFHQWSLERRNAWYAGANRGLIERASCENGGAR
jgi:hypothetical protein